MMLPRRMFTSKKRWNVHVNLAANSENAVRPAILDISIRITGRTMKIKLLCARFVGNTNT